jgi:hypothetical protein
MLKVYEPQQTLQHYNIITLKLNRTFAASRPPYRFRYGGGGKSGHQRAA